MTLVEEHHLDLETELRSGQQASVLLVSSAHVASIGLRAVVAESSDLRLVAEVPHGPASAAAARRHRADHILVAADRLTEAGITLLHELRSVSSDSTLIVCTNHFDREMVVALGQVPVLGILAWADVTLEAFHEMLALTARGLHVMSASAVEALLGPTPPVADPPALTETERAVFRGLEDELSTGEIARKLHLHQRAVQRAITSLQRKFGAGNRYTLEKRVGELALSSAIG
jgi:DNA-binding NarL/FixJ family response regulator